MMADPYDEDIFAEFAQHFEDCYGLWPQHTYLDDESDGISGDVKRDTHYLMFDNEEKYIKTVRPEWEKLPVQPEVASWSQLA